MDDVRVTPKTALSLDVAILEAELWYHVGGLTRATFGVALGPNTGVRHGGALVALDDLPDQIAGARPSQEAPHIRAGPRGLASALRDCVKGALQDRRSL